MKHIEGVCWVNFENTNILMHGSVFVTCPITKKVTRHFKKPITTKYYRGGMLG